ncbi:MAG: chloride channel protein [Acholeplasmatales bacterium]|nr:chloride channel protein [Acholeplasmatales bacterium]
MKKFGLFVLKTLLMSIIIGVFIALYQYLAHLVIDGSSYLLEGKLFVCILTICLALIGYAGLFYLNKHIPGYYGSGIPQIEAYHRGWYDFSGIKMLVLIIINSFYAFFTGFFLGSEGPSISIGTSIGMISNKLFKDDDKMLEACGGSAGFACAFASPLAGLCHLIEENKMLFGYKLILKGVLVIGLSFTISYLIYPHSLLPYFDMSFLPLKYYYLVPIISLLSLASGKLYMYLIVKFKDIVKNKKIMNYLTPILIIVFMLVRRFVNDVSGAGGGLLSLDIFDYSLLILFIILVGRLIGTAISVSSNTSGGVVLPMLAVGAITADILIKIYSLIDSDITQYLGIFIICGMLVVFAVVTKSPLTALVLGLKCSKIEVIILPLLISLVLSMIIVYLFKWENIYHKLEKRLKGYKEVHA